MDIDIIGNESNVDGDSAPFLFQFCHQGIPPLLSEAIIA
jgi:hypothetical protein